MMYRIILAVLFCLTAHVWAKELPEFADVSDAVVTGKSMTLVIHLNECQSQIPLPAVTVSIKPNAFLITSTNTITASDRHFTLDNPAARNIPVFDYSKYTINSMGKVLVHMKTLNALSYEQLSYYQIECELGKGFKVFA